MPSILSTTYPKPNSMPKVRYTNQSLCYSQNMLNEQTAENIESIALSIINPTDNEDLSDYDIAKFVINKFDGFFTLPVLKHITGLKIHIIAMFIVNCIKNPITTALDCVPKDYRRM